MKWHAVLVATGFFFLLAALYLAQALYYPWGTAAQPGPAVYLVSVGVLALVGALGTAVEALVKRPQESVEWPSVQGRWRVLTILGASAIYVVTLPVLGQPVCGTLLTLVVLQVMALRGWIFKIGVSLVVGLGSFYLFSVVLGVPLPAGRWWPW
jgi:putative tricarboxylic transport membrane protein